MLHPRLMLMLALLALALALALVLDASAASTATSTNDNGEETAPITSTNAPAVVKIAYQELQQFVSFIQDGAKSNDEYSSINDMQAELLDQVELAFGPNGLGILEVTGIPESIVQLRQKLLPMARQLAMLDNEELEALALPESFYSIGWSHGRERLKDGSYDTSKGSFYVNPFVAQGANDAAFHFDNVFPSDPIPELERTLQQMTEFMKDVGLWIVQLCDVYLEQMRKADMTTCSGHSKEDCDATVTASDRTNVAPVYKLYDTLRACENCKARLLHYYPRESTTTVATASSESQVGEQSTKATDTTATDDWCGWHTDHGSLTALLPGMFLASDGEMKNSAGDAGQVKGNGATGKGGLYIQPRTEGAQEVAVSLATTSIGYQIGETIEIQSQGRLQATPHAVRSTSRPNVSRESLALFLQPAPELPLPPLVDDGADPSNPMSLKSRWRSTFGEFQKATLQAYS